MNCSTIAQPTPFLRLWVPGGIYLIKRDLFKSRGPFYSGIEDAAWFAAKPTPSSFLPYSVGRLKSNYCQISPSFFLTLFFWRIAPNIKNLSQTWKSKKESLDSADLNLFFIEKLWTEKLGQKSNRQPLIPGRLDQFFVLCIKAVVKTKIRDLWGMSSML